MTHETDPLTTAPEPEQETPKYFEYYGIESAAGRLGLMVCRRCGATVMIGTSPEDAAKIHDAWHRRWDEGSR